MWNVIDTHLTAGPLYPHTKQKDPLCLPFPKSSYMCILPAHMAQSSREGFSWTAVRIILQTSQVGHSPEIKSCQPYPLEARGRGLVKADFILGKRCEKQLSSGSTFRMLTSAITTTPDTGPAPSTFRRKGLTPVLNQRRTLGHL